MTRRWLPADQSHWAGMKAGFGITRIDIITLGDGPVRENPRRAAQCTALGSRLIMTGAHPDLGDLRAYRDAVDAPHPDKCGSDAPIHSARSTWRRLKPHCPASIRQALRYRSQSPSRNPAGPCGIRPSLRRVFSALESATVNLSGRQAASTRCSSPDRSGKSRQCPSPSLPRPRNHRWLPRPCG